MINIDVTQIEIELNFSLKEFFIEELQDVKKHVPDYVFENILKHHLMPLNTVRSMMGIPIYISRSSGFRSVYHEEKKGRNGLSSHTFGTGKENPTEREKKGACDITIGNNHRDRFAELGAYLARLPYTRICMYPNNYFYHVDYKAESRHFFTCDTPTSTWKPARFEEMLEAAEDV